MRLRELLLDIPYNILETVDFKFIYRSEHLSKFPFWKSFVMVPHHIILWQIYEESTFILTKRHSGMGKVYQELFVRLKNHYYIERIMSRSIDNPYYNIFIIFLCGVICWVAFINSIKFSANLGAFVFVYLPLIFTGSVMLIYLLSRLLMKRFSWILTVIGGILLILIGALTFFGVIYN